MFINFEDAMTPAIAGNIVFGNTGDMLVGPQPETYDVEMVDPQLVISRMPESKLNPIPAPGSPALSGAATPTEEGVDATTYRGAFDNENWALGWTAMDQYGYFGILTSTRKLEDHRLGTANIFPNPVSKLDPIFQIDVVESLDASLSIYDLNGMLVSEIFTNKALLQGQHQFNINAKNLLVGTYFIVLQTDQGVLTQKLFIK